MISLWPAIDLMGGKVVRLRHGPLPVSALLHPPDGVVQVRAAIEDFVV